MLNKSAAVLGLVLTVSLAGCGGAGGGEDAMGLLETNDVVDLVRITSARNVDGRIEISCATQVTVSLVAEYPGSEGQTTAIYFIDPPVTTIEITDYDHDSGALIVLKPR